MPYKRKLIPIPDDCPAVLRCSRCKQEKPRDEFQRNRSTRTTYSHHCDSCNIEFSMETRFRKHIRESGREAFAQQTERQRHIIEVREKILAEFDADSNSSAPCPGMHPGKGRPAIIPDRA